MNIIVEAFDGHVIEKVNDVKTSLAAFHAWLMEDGLMGACHDDCEECYIHPRGCQMVRDDVRDLMNQGVLQVTSFAENENALVIEPCFDLPEPVEIPYYGGKLFRHMIICHLL